MQLICSQPCWSPSRPHQRRNGGQRAACSSRQVRCSAIRVDSGASRARRKAVEPKPEVPEQQAAADTAPKPAVASYFPLVLVSLLWGSYTPALRYLYSMDSLLTPQVLTAHRAIISAVALLSVSVISISYNRYQQHQELRQQQDIEQQLELQQQQQSTAHAMLGKLQYWLPDWVRHHNKPINSSNSSSKGRTNSSTDILAAATRSSSNEGAGPSTSTAGAVLAAGLELGIWNFLGTSSQAIGLELSTATKAAFLTQTTAVFTPCLAVLCGQTVSPAHWVACIVALLGSCCITLDSLIDVSAYKTPAAAVEAAAPAPAAVAFDGASKANSSSEQFSMISAPAVQSDVQQQATDNLVKYSSSNSIAAFSRSASSVGSRSTDAAAVISSSSSSGAAAVVAVIPAVTCSPTATPPQGVVPAIACAPVTTTVAVPAAAAPAATAVVPIDSSRTVEAGLFQQQQQLPQSQQWSGLVQDDSTLLQAADSSAARDTMQQQQQQDEVGTSATGTAAALGDTTGTSSSFSGELYILLACCCYAIATVRLSMLAPGLNPVHLATSKTLALAAASLCWLLAFQSGSVTSSAAVTAEAVEAVGGGSVKEAVAAALESAAEAWQLPATFSHGKGMLLLFYSALGPGALAAVMQAKGQSTVSAAQAQVFYSLTPVWAALMAMLLLQGEEMGPLAWIGGGVIVAASIGAAVSERKGSSGSGSSGDMVGSKQLEGK